VNCFFSAKKRNTRFNPLVTRYDSVMVCHANSHALFSANDRAAAVPLRDRSYRLRQHQVQLVLIHIDLRGTLWTSTIGVDGTKRTPDSGMAAARLSTVEPGSPGQFVGFFGGYPKQEKMSPAPLFYL
jgi:hypothetical protein